MTHLTPRDLFTAILAGLPMQTVEAVALFTGDGTTRLAPALELYLASARRAATQGAPPPTLLLTGGLDRPPYCVPADALHRLAVEHGIDPTRMIVDMASMHTRDNADQLAYQAKVNGWHRIGLVTNAYHMPRAYLTMLASMRSMDMLKDTLVLPVVAPAPWFVPVVGALGSEAATRATLLSVEALKITEHQTTGHCMSYEDGLAYLAAVEGVAG